MVSRRGRIELAAIRVWSCLCRDRLNFELIRDVPCAVPVGRWIELVIELGETTLEIMVDGKKVLEHDDAANSLPAGFVGLRPWQREAGYRNLWFETDGQRHHVPFLAHPAQTHAISELQQTHLPPIAFVTRHPFSRPNTISCALWQSQPTAPGCSIRIIDPSRPKQPAKTVFSDPDGCIFDMNVSFDARTLYFSYRPKGQQYWHLYLPDGRILFTRWEYVDRDLTFRQSLWTQNPDGSGYELYFGNTIRDVGTFWQARPLPGRTDVVVATFAPHHGWPHGAVGLITNRYGLESPRGEGFVWITKELQRMTSASQIMPGQTVTCIGCHEPRSEAPPAKRLPLAARRPPVQPKQPAWCEDGIVDFPTVVQPVLDKYCVSCHGGPNPDGGITLTGDKTRLFNMAYDNLLGRSRSYRQHDMATGEMPSSEADKGRPLVHFYWLLRTPTAVNRPLWTGSHASALLDYVDTEHCGRSIPLEDRQRIYLWIDANVPYYGTYAHSRPKSPGRRDLCTDTDTGAPSTWFAGQFLDVYTRRCQACHGAMPHPNDHARIWDGQLAWINFTNPELSPALTAHLPLDTGGRGLSSVPDGPPSMIFSDKADPDYRLMLQSIQTGRQKMLENPTADMPDFRSPRKEP